MELLVKRIKYAPSREWVNSYFELVKRVLKITGLDNDNPRLVMSLSPNSTGWHFPVTINNRYVVALRKEKEEGQTRLFVGLIFTEFSKEIPQLQNNLDMSKHWQFKNLHGEYSEPPYFLRFGNFSELLYWLETSEHVYKSWSEALLAEVKRAKSSPYRKSHEPLMCKMAVDVNFRAEILDMVFAESKPRLGLLPEQIDTPQEFYEGASKLDIIGIKINTLRPSRLPDDGCLDGGCASHTR